MKQLLTLTRRGHIWRRFLRRVFSYSWNDIPAGVRVEYSDWSVLFDHNLPAMVVQKATGVPVVDAYDKTWYRADKAALKSKGVFIFDERVRLWCKFDVGDLAWRIRVRVSDFHAETKKHDFAYCTLSSVGLYQEYWWERLLGIYHFYAKVIYARGDYVHEQIPV